MRFALGVSALLLLEVAVGLVPGVAAAVPRQQETEQAEQTPQAQPPEPFVIPEAEKNRKNPIKPSRRSIAMGGKLFASQCAMCHGEKGDGQGDLARELGLSVPDFTDASQQKKRTDGELFYILTKGRGEMPGQGQRLRTEQKWHMINFIRSLAATKNPKAEE